jgi:hypothetical protein
MAARVSAQVSQRRMTGGETLHTPAAAWRTEVTVMVSGAWSMVLMPAWFALLVQLLDQRERKTGQTLMACRCQRFTAALDGKAGRDQQQSSGREVTDINAVRRSERD